MFRRNLLIAGAVVALVALVGSELVRADRVVAGRPRRYKACVLLVPPANDPFAEGVGFTPANFANSPVYPSNPYVFYVLNKRTDVNPGGIEFYNPAAPGSITEAMRVRWDRIRNGPSGLSPGERLNQSMAPYWEMPLTEENFDRLSEMDILYLPVWNTTRFTEAQRKMLTLLVDRGLMLWVDWGRDRQPTFSTALGGPAVAPGSPRPDPFSLPLDFSDVANAPGGAWPVAPHPLIRGLFKLTQGEVETLGLNPGTPDNRGPRGMDLNPAFGYLTPRATPMLTMLIPGGGGSAYLAAARVGSGFVVATAGNVGGAISLPAWRTIPDLTPPAPATPPDLSPAEAVDMKFAYNVAWWRGEYNHSQKAPRKVAVGTDPLQGLLERWTHDGRPTVNGAPPALLPVLAAPLVADNMVISVLGAAAGGGNAFSVQAYELEPADDFNRDGFQDDGPVDFTQGAAYDRLGQWVAPAGGYVAGLAYGEINDIGYVFAAGRAGGDGGAWVLTAYNPLPPGTWLLQGPGTATLPSRPIWSSPAYSATPQPTLYLAGGSTGPTGAGMVAAYDFAAGGNLAGAWHFPPGQAADIIGPMVSSPVPAQIADKRTGAVDRIVLFTHLGNNKGPGGLGGLVLSTLGEPLTYAAVQGNPIPNAIELAPIRRTERWDENQPWEMRIINRIGPATGYTVSRTRWTGLPNPPVRFNVKGQPGRVSIAENLLPGGTAAAFQNLGGLATFAIVVDYANQMPQDATPGLPGGFTPPRRYFLPAFAAQGTGGQGGGQQTGIPGGVAVGPDDLAYYGTGRGYMAAVGFESSLARVRWKASIIHPAPLGAFAGLDNTNLDPYASGANWLSDHAFVNTPAAGPDVVAFASREGVVYVFEADATVSFKLPIALPLTRQQVDQLELGQLDETLMNPQRFPKDQYTVDPDSGTVTFRDMRGFTFFLDRASRPAQLGGKLGVKVQWQSGTLQGEADVPVPLVYFFDLFAPVGDFPRERFLGSPVISGDRIYVVGSSGLAYELPLDPRKDDATFGTLAVMAPSPADLDLARWRSGALVKARQLQVSPFPCFSTPSISQGIFAATTANGITAYHSPALLVADNNRIVEATGNSTLLASIDSVRKQVIQGSGFPIPTDPKFTQAFGQPIVTTSKFIDRPATVKRLSRNSSLSSVFFSTAPSEFPSTLNPTGTTEHSEIADSSTLIADSGNNRVVEVNPAGKVIGEFTEFQDPFKILPAGESLTLNTPTDVHRWVDTEIDAGAPSGPPLLVFHTLIVDSGNSRVLEIVDKIRYRSGNFAANSFVIQPGQNDFSGNPIQWYHVLVWSTQTNAQGLKLKYRTAQRIFWMEPALRSQQNPRGYRQDPAYQAGVPSPFPPYLVRDPWYAVTMATVNGQQVFFRTTSAPNQAQTARRVPQARLGGDTLLFLVGRRHQTARGLEDTGFREADPAGAAFAADPDKFAYVQGSIDPLMPLIREIYPNQAFQQGEPSVHTLNGVTSVQRTIRTDLNFPALPGRGQAPDEYFLIADQGGVFEFRLDERFPFDPATEDHRARLAWAFTKDDYAYATGAGWGQRPLVRNPMTTQYQGEVIAGPNVPFFRVFTPSSARWLTNGRVLISSRTSTLPGAAAGATGAAISSTLAAADIFMLRPTDFNLPISWIPDHWVQNRYMVGAPGWPVALPPSITWRTPEQPRRDEPPTPLNLAVNVGQFPGQTPPFAAPNPMGRPNPLGLTGTYVPQQPSYADLIF